MSEYLSKKAVLEWFGLMHLEYSHNTAVSEFIESGIEIFESGAFDADTSEIQRLRAALERIKKWADDPEPGTMLKIRNLANETMKGEENA